MRLKKVEIDDRIVIKLNRGIKADNVKGIMTFGEDNDYPQIMESLILSSVDAKAIAKTYSRFLVGKGFKNTGLNNYVVGKDYRGKEITLLSLLRQFADSVSYYYGGYIHTNFNGAGKVVSARIVPFKNCRFSEPDTRGFSGKIVVSDKWGDKKFKKSELNTYNVFNTNKDVFLAQVAEQGGVTKHKGQIFFHFFDNSFMYPLSLFDPIYLDADTQAQISIFKNNQIRNGFTDKTIFRIAGDEDSLDEISLNIKQMMGADGDNATIIEDTVNPETGKIDDKSQIVVDKIPSNINDKLFETWEKSLTNNIRKAANGLPSVLIDYDESKLGTTSGEGIIQAFNYYNEQTSDDRASISECFKSIFKHFQDDLVAEISDWSIEPLKLEQNVVNL